ncbi:MAG: hypothetical protein Q3995_02070 [Eubacteriales bacterium]|nr:hypothetical protein [Eubacteriales bacterium]
MKKVIYLQYLLAHLLLMVLGAMVMVAEVFLSPNGAVSPLWALMVLPMAAAAYMTGRKLRIARLEKTDECWNAAMVLYVISLALLALLWRFAENHTAVFVINVWNFPTAPVLLGFDAWIGNRVLPHGGNGFYALLRSTAKYHDLYLPIMGAVLAALEPLCLTLGFLSGTKKTNEENETNA